jgi:uracil-DNA glycosylase family protein
VKELQASTKKLNAADFLPAERDLPALRLAAANCRGCPLWENATQTIFGGGRSSARIVLVGEQPGDQEDLAGKPFVGPAGKLLDEALIGAKIGRDDVYVTNAVKHFKWMPRGKRRIHQKPSSREILACRPWLVAEIEAVRPKAIVCLGVTATHGVFGRPKKISEYRGQLIESELCPSVLITVHPSSLLRITDHGEREASMKHFVGDLRIVAHLL